MNEKLHRVVNKDGSTYGYHFQCPGCATLHTLPTNVSPNAWQFNEDLVKPTFKPSVLMNRGSSNPTRPVCHSFITDGMIKFLDDCTHELAGQTVELGALPDWLST